MIINSSFQQDYCGKNEAVTILCRHIATNVKPKALRYLDGQLESAWNGNLVRFSQTAAEHIV